MSGLLPRTQPNSGTGVFTNLQTQNLVVTGTGFIGTLDVAALNPTVLTTSTINGDPALAIGATNVTMTCSQPISMTINNTDATTFANELRFDDVGTPTIAIGSNNFTDEGYLWTYPARPIKFGTNNTERARIDGSTGQITLSNSTGVYLPTSANTSFSWASKGDLGYSAFSGTWFSSAAAGDVNLRNQDTTKTLNLGLGNATAQVQIGNAGTNLTTAVTLSSVANDNTPTHVLALNGSSVVVYKTNVADTASSQVFTNKTIDSASNTLTITSSPLSATNINSLLNQDVRTTATPTFAGVSLVNTLLLTTTSFHPITVNNTGMTSGSDILFQSNGTNQSAFGVNESLGTPESYVWNYANIPLKFGTNNSERLRIAASGIGTDNTMTNILGSSSGTLAYKTNLVDTSSTQTLTGKTLDSASNTLTVNSTNVNSLLDQDVRTTSDPTFDSVSLTSLTTVLSLFGGIFQWIGEGAQTTSNATPVVVKTYTTTSGRSYIFGVNLTGYAVSGPNAGKAFYQNTQNGAVNNSGTLTLSNTYGNQFALNGLAGAGLSFTASGADVQIGVIGTALDTIRIRWMVTIFVNG
jgi:hypothetical protein